MAEKKLLTYEGLEEYNIKWHERLQAMMIGDEDLDEIWDEVISPPYWLITIDTEAANEGDTMGQIPFCLYGVQNASMTVDWGDGTVETYASANAVENSCPTHEYADAGEYTIRMESDDFSRLYLWTNLDGEEGDPYVYIATLKSIDKPLPQIAGVHKWWYNDEEDGIGDIDNNFDYCFYYFSSLQSIPARLFDKNTVATSFNYCFAYCTSLQSIPEGLFDKNTAATDFNWCFYRCSSLQSIPEGLFDKNTAATNFGVCFSDCSSLQSIPEGLFDKNTAATNFSGCFQGCSSLTNFTLHIGSSSVSSCSSFVTKKTGTTRTIYVPDNSTTKTKFDAVASSLELTIIPYTPA